ncbi:ankyrin repeat domain-containing protein [Parashewanella spongiae]|uniref:Ankyrin repeat domain-containing protein n=2 Tax=Parashewanella spongiae TaxID=342950 RepID=A0A3A6TX99_9GAMM|nr:ankyrin repeat domain-containing protein [Parashewanella spongiae]
MSCCRPTQTALLESPDRNITWNESRGKAELNDQRSKAYELLESFVLYAQEDKHELIPLGIKLEDFLIQIQSVTNTGSIKSKTQFATKLTQLLKDLTDLIRKTASDEQLPDVQFIVTTLVSSEKPQNNRELLDRIMAAIFEISLVKKGIYLTNLQQRKVIISRLVRKELWECDSSQIVKESDVDSITDYLKNTLYDLPNHRYQPQLNLPEGIEQSTLPDLSSQVQLLATNKRVAARVIDKIAHEAVKVVEEKRHCFKSQCALLLDNQVEEKRLNSNLQALFNDFDFDLWESSFLNSGSEKELSTLFTNIYERGCQSIEQVLTHRDRVELSLRIPSTQLNLESSHGLYFYLKSKNGIVQLTLDHLSKVDWYEFPLDICFNMLEQVIGQVTDLEQLIRFIQTESFKHFLTSPYFQTYGEHLRLIIVERFQSSSSLESQLLQKYEQGPLCESVLALSRLLPEVECNTKAYVNHHKKYYRTLLCEDVRKLPLNILLLFSATELKQFFTRGQLSYLIVKSLNLKKNEVVVWLIANVENFGELEWNRKSILYIFCQLASLNILILLNNTSRFNLNEATPNGKPLIHVAIKTGREDIALWLLDKQPLELAYRDNKQNSLLHISIINKQEYIAKVILQRCTHRAEGAGFIQAVNFKGDTALHLACLFGMHNLVLLIINNGCDVNIRNFHKKTVFHFAIQCKQKEVVEMLLSTSNLNVLLLDNYGRTALAYASADIYSEIYDKHFCRILFSNEYFRLFNSKSGTWLHKASSFHCEELESIARINGIDLGARDVDNNTPLHIACYYGVHQAVETLIRLGAEVNTVNHQGELPIDIAIQRGHVKALSLLIGLGKVKLEPTRKETALAFALALNEVRGSADYSSVIHILTVRFSVEVAMLIADQ